MIDLPPGDPGALVFCPVCRQTTRGLGPNKFGREVACLNCGSLDRHRMIVLVILAMLRRVPPRSTVLDFAPTDVIAGLLEAAAQGRYVSTDLDVSRYGDLLDLQADITSLPIRDGSVGLLHCSHVLEHVPDDAAAAAEIARVLDPAGAALILTPRRQGQPTDEDPEAPIDERIERFGQDDHVRLYGDDLEARLERAGLRVKHLIYSDILPAHLRRLIGVAKTTELWIATVTGDPADFVTSDDVIAALMSETLADMDALRAQRDEASAEADDWREHYDWLNDQTVVRMARRLKRMVSPGQEVENDG